eukprot:g843.t1 g843   contig10:832898-833890(+)
MKLPRVCTGIAIALVCTLGDCHPLERPISIINESGQRLELYWVGSNDEMVLQSPPNGMQKGQTLSLNSYVNHTFVLRELPSASGTCNEGTKYSSPSVSPVCKTRYITVNEHNDQVIHVKEDLQVEVEDSDTKAQTITSSIVSACRDKVKQRIIATDLNASEALDAFATCAQPLVARQIEESNKEIKAQADLRVELGEMWEEYTCSDYNLATTSPKSTHTWNYQGQDHTVGVLLDRDEAKIHYVKNFITPEECEAIEKAAAPKLHQATVADGSGGSHLQKSRKSFASRSTCSLGRRGKW